MFIPSFHRSEPRVEPNCPHCHTELTGQDEPSDFSPFKFISIIIITMWLVLSLLIGFIGGLFSGLFNQCDRFGDFRYHYFVPTLVPSCVIARYLTNKEEIYNKVYDKEGNMVLDGNNQVPKKD